MPTIEQIRSVYEIAKTGSISQAAKNLYTSQPYLSTVLKEVERELKVSLFDRTNKGVVLTEQGTLFIQYAEELLALMRRFNALQYQISKPDQVSLTVGGTYAMIMHEIFHRFHSIHQDKPWRLSYIERTYQRILEMILSNQADISIQSIDLEYGGNLRALFDSKELQFYPLYEDEIAVLVGENHPLFSRQSVLRKELEPYPFVTAPNMTLPKYFLLNKQVKKDPLTFENSRNMIYHVSQSMSYSFGVPVLNANDPLLKIGKLKYLKIEDYQYPIQVGYLIRKDRKENEALDAYIAYLTEFFDNFHLDMFVGEEKKTSI